MKTPPGDAPLSPGFNRTKPRPNRKIPVQIVESHRRADQVSQRIVRHVGQAVNDREVEELKRLASTIIAEMENQKRPRLLGGEGEDLGQSFTNRYDVSGPSASGLANIVLKVTSPGTLILNAQIPACGIGPTGRWCPEVLLSPVETITVQ